MKPECLLIHGSSARMDAVPDGGADFIFTSPPYFSPETESLLRQPVKRQTDSSRVQREVIAYAHTLMPSFLEMQRILRNGGALAMQTKDLRYGGCLLKLAGTHREMMEEAGLRLVTRFFWRKRGPLQRRSAAFLRYRCVGSFEADDVEEFLIFSHPGGITHRRERAPLTEEEAKRSVVPLWESPPILRGRTHPFQTPPVIVRRLLQMFTLPGDLVVDPFAGHGTTIRLAAEMGRRGIGYELDAMHAQTGQRLIQEGSRL